MKVLTVSDKVETILYDNFQIEQFPGIELILACGDLPKEYLSFLVSMFNVPLFYIKGNHDLRPDGYKPGGCIDVNEKLVVHKGIRILGFQGSHWYNGEPNQYTERQMRRKIQKMRLKLWWHKGFDIVITHAPARHIHDKDDPCHRGFQCFRDLIERYAPGYFLHGHMHLNYTYDAPRMTEVNDTKVINSYGYYIFEIKTSQRVA